MKNSLFLFLIMFFLDRRCKTYAPFQISVQYQLLNVAVVKYDCFIGEFKLPKSGPAQAQLAWLILIVDFSKPPDSWPAGGRQA